MLSWICEVTGARSARRGARLQSLWSGYGEIMRVHLEGGPAPTVIVKRVTPPQLGAGSADSPEGRSHARKLRSYEVEAAWYRDWAARCSPPCRVPRSHGVARRDGGWLFALEDLDAAGFPERRRQLSDAELTGCLEWLAALHATFLGRPPSGLWQSGTYWHLDTRPDELRTMGRGPLRESARAIDAALASCRHQTLVHGDAKTANFCFGAEGVAAVDFQYIGGGCGMKDVVYLLSCLDSRRCDREAEDWLDHYFETLATNLEGRAHDAEAIEAEWRALYPMAWADFQRFLGGWAPALEHRHAYGTKMTRRALASLTG